MRERDTRGRQPVNLGADFSVAYADQNQRDYEALHEAVADGTLSAQTGL